MLSLAYVILYHTMPYETYCCTFVMNSYVICVNKKKKKKRRRRGEGERRGERRE